MSREIENIKGALADFSGRYGPSVILPATVISVNEDDATVHVKLSDGSEIDDARLKSVVAGNAGFYALPAVGSVVQIARIENSSELVVIAMAEVSKVVIKKGADSLGSLISSLIDEVQKIYAPKNTAAIALIKIKLNNLLK